ncbi:MAG: septal ring lytic transglycosylase RlpA family protein [Caulobacterales bacterium]
MQAAHFAKYFIVALALSLAGCSAPERAPVSTDVSAFAPETGMASWYGGGLHGRATANGETFDQNDLTAAHPTWPMHSLVDVTNLENGRRVVVRVNDRGPYARGRIIDVSRAAARALDFEGDGHTRVTISYIGPAPAEGPR